MCARVAPRSLAWAGSFVVAEYRRHVSEALGSQACVLVGGVNDWHGRSRGSLGAQDVSLLDGGASGKTRLCGHLDASGPRASHVKRVVPLPFESSVCILRNALFGLSVSPLRNPPSCLTPHSWTRPSGAMPNHITDVCTFGNGDGHDGQCRPNSTAKS